MNVGKSITKAIDEVLRLDYESAMLHACNAIDGTAAKLHPTVKSNRARFTKLLRDNYVIFGPMCMPGINLVETRFPINGLRPNVEGGKPDIADVIYGIHRCTHSHGDELPDGSELIQDLNSQVTRIGVGKGEVSLSDRTIFGLIAVAVCSPVNIGQSVPEGYYLTLNGVRMDINQWWGRAADFASVSGLTVMPQVIMDFGDWMD